MEAGHGHTPGKFLHLHTLPIAPPSFTFSCLAHVRIYAYGKHMLFYLQGLDNDISELLTAIQFTLNNSLNLARRPARLKVLNKVQNLSNDSTL